MGDRKSGWRSNVSATAKLLLCGVRDSADAFPPLKSVVGGLCFILENYEVWFAPYATQTVVLRIISENAR